MVFKNIEINYNGLASSKLWDKGHSVYLYKRIFGFYILIWKKCNHKWKTDKVKNFAYCEICLSVIKDNKLYSKEEYKKKYLIS